MLIFRALPVGLGLLVMPLAAVVNRELYTLLVLLAQQGGHCQMHV